MKIPYLILCGSTVFGVHAPVTEAELYVGAAALGTDFDLEQTSGETISDTTTGYKLDFGYDFNKYIAVQLSYLDFGALESGWFIEEGGFEGAIGKNVSLESQAISLSITAKWPIGQRFNILGEVGTENWEVDYDVKLRDPWGPPGYTFHADDRDTFWGVGASYDIGQSWGSSLMFYYRKRDTKFNLDTLEHKTLAAGIYYRF